VDGAELIRACEEAAAAALIARAYPYEGGHHPAQVLGGFLARAGWPVPRVKLFAEAVLHHVSGPHARDHVRTAQNAAEAHERGSNAYGFPQLAETFGEKRAKAIAKWLHYTAATNTGTGRTSTKWTRPAADSESDPHKSLIAELVALPPLKYARQRKEAAAAIGIPLGMLDKLVNEQRKAGDAAAAQPPHWDVEPWPESVEGAALLDAVANVLSRYAVLPQHAREALALWVAHAWALDCFQCSPFATLVSPTKRCGKTRVLAILKWLSPRSELAGSISAAALFRYIQSERPTLLMDEADRTVAENEELQGILNASHKRVGAYVIRCEGDDNRPRRFSTWAPKAIATISRLADTLRDRSIVVEMRRKTADEAIERWNEDDTEELSSLRRKLLRWTEDHAEELKRTFPDAPAGLDDRAADNWRPLLAVADAAGGNWAEHARTAAVALTGGREDDDTLPRLLGDIRAIFSEMERADWIGSTPLAERLAMLDSSPWQEWKRGKPITPAGVARLLKRAGIHPNRSAGTGGRYLKSAFEDAWRRYLPGEG
jgi:putative DNA primase/helicase